MTILRFAALLLALALSFTGTSIAVETLDSGWALSDAPGARSLHGAPMRELSLNPPPRTRSQSVRRIPAPGRYFVPERTFSLIPEQVQFDRAKTPRELEPFSTSGLIKNMLGVAYHGYSPSDSTIAVGPNHVVVAVNTSLAVYAKGGAKLALVDFEDFFADFDDVSGAFFFDPKLVYDHLSNHFILLVDAYRESDDRSWYMIVVTRTSDARSGWVGWALDMSLNGNARTRFWADYPGLGYDSNAVYVTGNMYNIPGNFQYAKLRILRKNELYAFDDLGWHDFWNLRDSTGNKTFTLMPVRSIGTVSSEYMISANSGQGAGVTLWNVQNAAGNPTVTKKRVNVPSYSTAYDHPARQKGGGSLIDPGDSRLSDAVLRDGVVYVSHTIQKDWGSGVVSAIRIYRIASSGTLLQAITFGADGAFYYYPAVTADAKGNMIVVFDRSSTGEFAGIRFTHQKPGDSEFQASSVLKAGMSNYFWSPDNFNIERWGDYSGIANDSDGSVWVHSQYADTPLKEWTTRIGRLKY